MSFQPVVPLSGYTGWRFLQRTQEAQQTAFNESQIVSRTVENFREKIGSIQTAEDLVNDRQLLQVALGAFGLDDDINNKFFIQKVLEEGTLANDTLANRLADKRYGELSKAFSFDLTPPNTQLSTFPDDIVERYQNKQFEVAVGEVNNDLRFALNLQSGLSDILENNQTQDAQWFAVMGNPPLRRVFEQALSLPSSIGQIDLDQQLDAFKDQATKNFGTDQLSELNNPESQEKLIRLFLVRSQLEEFSGLSAGSVALSLLSNAR